MIPTIAALVVTVIAFLYMCLRQMVPAAYVKSVAAPIQRMGQRYLARQLARQASAKKGGGKKPPLAKKEEEEADAEPEESKELTENKESEKNEETSAYEIIMFRPVELLIYLGACFAGSWFCVWKFYTSGLPFLSLASCCIAYIAIALSAGTDLKNRIVPNEIVVGTLVLQAVVLALQSLLVAGFFPTGVIHNTSCLLVVFVLLFVISRIAGGGLGLGDVKLLAVLGFCLGYSLVFSTIFYAIFASFFAAMFLLITHKKGRKQTIPFAPFIFLGYLLTIGFGM